MTINTPAAKHAFQGGYDAQQHQPDGSEDTWKDWIVKLVHEIYTDLSLVEYFPGCFKLCISDWHVNSTTHPTRVDRADIEDFYYNAYDYTDEDDEVLLYRIMTAIATIKLFDGMRKFVGWEEV